jgi:hypothetical protein
MKCTVLGKNICLRNNKIKNRVDILEDKMIEKKVHLI